MHVALHFCCFSCNCHYYGQRVAHICNLVKAFVVHYYWRYKLATIWKKAVLRASYELTSFLLLLEDHHEARRRIIVMMHDHGSSSAVDM